MDVWAALPYLPEFKFEFQERGHGRSRSTCNLHAPERFKTWGCSSSHLISKIISIGAQHTTHQLRTTTHHNHGRPPCALLRLPLRLPPHRPRIATPADFPHRASHTPPPATAHHSAARHLPPNTYSTGRFVGWRAQRRTQKEDVSHEEATPIHGRQGIEGRHGVEQVQRVWADEEGACAVSLLCAE